MQKEDVIPFHVQWAIKPRIFYAELSGVMTLDNIIQMDKECVEYIRQTDQLVHGIVRFMNVERPPLNAVKLREAGKALDEPNIGWMILVTTNPTVRIVGNLYSQIRTRAPVSWHRLTKHRRF